MGRYGVLQSRKGRIWQVWVETGGVRCCRDNQASASLGLLRGIDRLDHEAAAVGLLFGAAAAATARSEERSTQHARGCGS
jgi:hypothetical protein